jgi:hypothetical protein
MSGWDTSLRLDIDATNASRHTTSPPPREGRPSNAAHAWSAPRSAANTRYATTTGSAPSNRSSNGSSSGACTENSHEPVHPPPRSRRVEPTVWLCNRLLMMSRSRPPRPGLEVARELGGAWWGGPPRRGTRRRSWRPYPRRPRSGVRMSRGVGVPDRNSSRRRAESPLHPDARARAPLAIYSRPQALLAGAEVLLPVRHSLHAWLAAASRTA